jgi:segregation and condensation protein A
VLTSTTTVVVDHTPLSVHMDNILTALQTAGGELRFTEVFTPPHTRSRLIGLFQALLELAKGRRLVPVQPEPFGDIWLRLGETIVESELNPTVPRDVVA